MHSNIHHINIVVKVSGNILYLTRLSVRAIARHSRPLVFNSDMRVRVGVAFGGGTPYESIIYPP